MTAKKLQAYDPARHGNPYSWIISEAEKIRRQRAADIPPALPQIDYLTGKQVE